MNLLYSIILLSTTIVIVKSAEYGAGYNQPSIAVPQGQQGQPQGQASSVCMQTIPCFQPTISYAMPQGQNESPPLGTIEARPLLPTLMPTSSASVGICFPSCSTFYFISSSTSCITTSLPASQSTMAPSQALNRTQYLIFDQGFERSRNEAADFCGNLTLLSNGTVLYPIIGGSGESAQGQGQSPFQGESPTSAQGPTYNEAPQGQSGPAGGYYGMADFLSALQVPTSQANSSSNATNLAMNATLADVSNSLLFRRLSSAIQSPVYIRSWQGDNYRDACIALYPGGAIAVPREGCQGPLGFICQLNPPSNSTSAQLTDDGSNE